ncbi:unnamed protein product [Linum tenue]|uniref:Uncharacterized protein n=1 Tax=Linum tenue TaxID=586396 RepID=A0AAV0MHJ1_9ROSI|nr:unnamed protein product [Linum tenue]
MAHGHLIPVVDMAKLFASRGVKTTVVTTPNQRPSLLQNHRKTLDPYPHPRLPRPGFPTAARIWTSSHPVTWDGKLSLNSSRPPYSSRNPSRTSSNRISHTVSSPTCSSPGPPNPPPDSASPGQATLRRSRPRATDPRLLRHRVLPTAQPPPADEALAATVSRSGGRRRGGRFHVGLF